ncbi:MAG: hypothetical protein AAF399_31040, partial [Bacteroidota bacterium]
VIRQARRQSENLWNVKVTDLSILQTQISPWPSEKKVDFLVWLVGHFNKENYRFQLPLGPSPYQRTYGINSLFKSLIALLTRRKLSLDPDQFYRLYEVFNRHTPSYHQAFSYWPLFSLLNQVNRQLKGNPLPHEWKQILQAIRDNHQVELASYEKKRLQLLDKLDQLLYPNHLQGLQPPRWEGKDRLAAYANPQLAALPSPEQAQWYQLLRHARRSTNATPSQRFLATAKELIDPIGRESFQLVLEDWLGWVSNLTVEKKSSIRLHDQPDMFLTESFFLSKANLQTLKGLVWMSTLLPSASMASLLGAMAKRCYRKIPQVGATAQALGNACVWALTNVDEIEAIGELTRLRIAVVQTNNRNRIAKALRHIAQQREIPLANLEDMGVDELGLIGGIHTEEIGGFRAEIHLLKAGKSRILWYRPDGKPQK